jgi:hypothetical protein
MATSVSPKQMSPNEEDDLLLDASGDLRSGQQPSPAPPPRSPSAPVIPVEKLTPGSFRLVRHQADRVRSFIQNKEKARAFLDYNLRLQQQALRPKWMQPTPSMPLLPGSTPFPRDVHDQWTNITRKYERKLHKQVTKSLPSVIDAMEERIHLEREAGLQKVKDNISDSAEKRRAEFLYLRFVNQTDRIPSLLSRQRGAGRRSTNL